MNNLRLANWLQWLALGIMAIYAAFWALYAAGDVMVGEFTGAVYFLPVLFILGLMALAWKRPMIGGIVILILGVLLSLRTYTSLAYPDEKISAALVVGGPFVLSGILFLISSVLPKSGSPVQETGLQPEQR